MGRTKLDTRFTHQRGLLFLLLYFYTMSGRSRYGGGPAKRRREPGGAQFYPYDEEVVDTMDGSHFGRGQRGRRGRYRETIVDGKINNFSTTIHTLCGFVLCEHIHLCSQLFELL